MWESDCEESWAKELMLLNCCVGEDSWESLGLQGDPTSPFWRRSALGFLWREWCWSWNSNTLTTSWEELTHLKRLWCWEGLGTGGEGDSRGWDGWMASRTRWTWVWVNSGRWSWTGRPGVLRFMGSQRVGHDWATEVNTVDDSKFRTTISLYIILFKSWGFSLIKNNSYWYWALTLDQVSWWTFYKFYLIFTIEPPRDSLSLNVYSFTEIKLICNIVLVSGIQ